VYRLIASFSEGTFFIDAIAFSGAFEITDGNIPTGETFYRLEHTNVLYSIDWRVVGDEGIYQIQQKLARAFGDSSSSTHQPPMKTVIDKYARIVDELVERVYANSFESSSDRHRDLLQHGHVYRRLLTTCRDRMHVHVELVDNDVDRVLSIVKAFIVNVVAHAAVHHGLRCMFDSTWVQPLRREFVCDTPLRSERDFVSQLQFSNRYNILPSSDATFTSRMDEYLPSHDTHLQPLVCRFKAQVLEIDDWIRSQHNVHTDLALSQNLWPGLLT